MMSTRKRQKAVPATRIARRGFDLRGEQGRAGQCPGLFELGVHLFSVWSCHYTEVSHPVINSLCYAQEA